MKIVSAIGAVADLIEDNKDSLVSGIVHQGEKRAIMEINKSLVTPWKTPYALMCNCQNVSRTYLKSANVARGAKINTYSMEIYVVDVAIPQQTDDAQEPFWVMTRDHWILVERIVALIEGTSLFTSSDSDEFRLVPTSSLDVENGTGWFDSAASPFPMLSAVIRFKIYGCA